MIILRYLGKNKEGLAGRFKIAGQIVLGIIVGLTLFFSNEVRIAEKVDVANLTFRERHEILDNSVQIPSQGSV
jgi:phospho-N-acetylmuramoyl-pentapeptide-transferase